MSYANKKEIAVRYRTSTRSINNWMRNLGMPHMTVGRQVKFRIDECDEWFKRFAKT